MWHTPSASLSGSLTPRGLAFRHALPRGLAFRHASSKLCRKCLCDCSTAYLHASVYRYCPKIRLYQCQNPPSKFGETGGRPWKLFGTSTETIGTIHSKIGHLDFHTAPALTAEATWSFNTLLTTHQASLAGTFPSNSGTPWSAVRAKLQALVYDILPSTTASYVIGS